MRHNTIMHLITREGIDLCELLVVESVEIELSPRKPRIVGSMRFAAGSGRSGSPINGHHERDFLSCISIVSIDCAKNV
jgi:hypothetical protein